MSDKEFTVEFIIKVIENVEKHRCLWDLSSPSYGKREKTEAAWNSIAYACERPVNFCRDKWKNVRTGFLRSLREHPENTTIGGHKIVKKKQFYLYEYMQFLLPTIRNTDSSSSASLTHNTRASNVKLENNDSTNKSMKAESSGSEILDYDDFDNFVNVDLPQEGYYAEYDNGVVTVRNDLEQKHMVTEDEPPKKKFRVANDNVEIMDTKEELALMSFFKGIAPDVLSMSVRNQRFFKRRMVELVDDLHKEEETEPVFSSKFTPRYFCSKGENGS